MEIKHSPAPMALEFYIQICVCRKCNSERAWTKMFLKKISSYSKNKIK